MADVSIKKSSALATISSELAKQGKVTEALKTARGISDERQMSFALATISSELAKQGKVTEALEMARGISDEGQKRSALVAISTELAKQGKVTEALETARWISDENDKSSALRAISTELAKQGNLTLAEEIGLEFQSTADRHKCWTDIASGIFALKGAIESLPIGQSFYSDEARLFYQQGWSQALIPKDANDDLLNTALPQLASDPISLKNILQAHALYCIFFVQADKQKTHRINQVLDIQWAVDIAARFPKPS